MRLQRAVVKLVGTAVFGLGEPAFEDGGEVVGHFAEGEAHALFGFLEGYGGVGFEKFVFGVDFDGDVGAGWEGIVEFDVAAAEAEVGDFGGSASVFAFVNDFGLGDEGVARSAAAFGWVGIAVVSFGGKVS